MVSNTGEKRERRHLWTLKTTRSEVIRTKSAPGSLKGSSAIVVCVTDSVELEAPSVATMFDAKGPGHRRSRNKTYE